MFIMVAHGVTENPQRIAEILRLTLVFDRTGTRRDGSAGAESVGDLEPDRTGVSRVAIWT